MALSNRTGRAVLHALAAVCFIAAVPVRAHAQDAPPSVAIEEPASPGAAAFARAQGAWEKKEYDRAETAFQEAIEQGGLGPEEVREAYVKLGSSRALRGKNDAAVRAFRAAAVLDDFKIPAQLKPAQARLAEQAKKDVSRMGIGAMAFTAAAPDKTAPARAFNVKVTLDERHVPVVEFFLMTAKESTTGKNISKQEGRAATAEIEVPAYMAPPGGQITVRVDAVDKYKNRLATADVRITVEPISEPAARIDVDEPKKTETGRHRSIFSTPWPYVIGGIVVLGLGAAFVVQATKADEVSIGSIGVKSN